MPKRNRKVPQWAYSPLLKRKGGEHSDRFRFGVGPLSHYDVKNMSRLTMHKVKNKSADIVSGKEFRKLMGWCDD